MGRGKQCTHFQRNKKIYTMHTSKAFVNIDAQLYDSNPKSANFRSNILQSLSENFIDSPYDNVKIQCSDGAFVSTSAVLLAAMSPWIRDLLHETGQTEEFSICLPSVHSEDLLVCLRNLASEEILEPTAACLFYILRPELYYGKEQGYTMENGPETNSVNSISNVSNRNLTEQSKIQWKKDLKSKRKHNEDNFTPSRY